MWRPARVVREDLHIVGERLVAGPPAPATATVDARGAYAVPLVVDTALAGLPSTGRFDLVLGNRATLAVVRHPVTETEIRSMLVVAPRALLAVWVDGRLEAWDGSPTRPAGQDVTDPTARATWVGTWWDRRRDLAQHLGPDGRYSETRGGQADAYTGRYWVRGDRITYLDDAGFWAFGQLVDGVLHHAGFVLVR